MSRLKFHKIKLDLYYIKVILIRILLYEVMPMMTEELKNLLEHYKSGLSLYRERKFKDAVKHFKKVLEIRSEDGPSKLYIERCEMLIKEPPSAEWDGIFTMTTK